MIIDSFDKIEKYKVLLPHLEDGLKAMQKANVSEKGRYEFAGGYFMVQIGCTNPLEQGSFEAHRRFIDVQILLEGSEEIAWAPYESLEICELYNAETDKERLQGERRHCMLIEKGMFWCAFPWDAHKAISHTGEKEHYYRKIVMKLPVEEEKI